MVLVRTQTGQLPIILKLFIGHLDIYVVATMETPKLLGLEGGLELVNDV